MIHGRPWRVDHSIMINVTWRQFDQSANQLIFGHTTNCTEMHWVVVVSERWCMAFQCSRRMASALGCQNEPPWKPLHKLSFLEFPWQHRACVSDPVLLYSVFLSEFYWAVQWWIMMANNVSWHKPTECNKYRPSLLARVTHDQWWVIANFETN